MTFLFLVAKIGENVHLNYQPGVSYDLGNIKNGFSVNGLAMQNAIIKYQQHQSINERVIGTLSQMAR